MNKMTLDINKILHPALSDTELALRAELVADYVSAADEGNVVLMQLALMTLAGRIHAEENSKVII